MHHETTSEFVMHVQCDACGSSDANSLYTDNHQYCFACGNHVKGDSDSPAPTEKVRKNKELIDSEPFNVPRRNLTTDTFTKFRYQQGTYNGERVHVANYIREGNIVAQKLRFADKRFVLLGDTKNIPLYGQHLWRDGGKRITITEGEIDCLSVSQAQQNKWPVVSVPNGAQGAKRDLAKHLEWLERFEEIILCFDNDEPGQKAMLDCSLLFTPGKAKIARLPLKDANEMLKEGRQAELIAALWDAKANRPDGVMSGSEVLESGNFDVEWGDSWPFETVTQWTYGMREHEMYAYGAGTGCGKTDTLKKVVGHLIKHHGRKVGTILLEEPNLMLTLETIAGQIDETYYHLPDRIMDEEQKEATKALVASHLEMYRVGGPLDTESLLGIIRYMVVGLGCKHVFLDHITYILDGAGDDRLGAMKSLMRSMNDLNKELPFTLHYVSHLRKSKAGGKTHEEGGRVTLDDFEGGKAATQYANFVFGLERDQQGEDEHSRDISIFRCLKDRYTGQSVGRTLRLKYDRLKGTKYEADDDDVPADSPDEASTYFW